MNLLCFWVVEQTLYNTCRENNITGCESQDDQKGIRLIAKNLKIKENNAIDYFERGQKIYDARIKAQEKKEHKEQQNERDRDIQFAESVIAKTKKFAQMTGKDKYLKPHLEEIRKDISNAKAAHKKAKQVHQAADYMFRERNSGVAGGVAQAIGGVGAGLAAYAEAEQQNAATRAAKAEFLKSAGAVDSSEYRADASVQASATFYNWYANWLAKVVVDDENTASWFDSVHLTVVEPEEYENTVYMLIRIIPEVAQEFSVLNYPASLDGVVRVDVYDGDTKAGTSLYIPYGFGSVDLSETGFSVPRKRTVIIKSETGRELKADKAYTYKFIPEKLWLVQAKKISEDDRKKYGSSYCPDPIADMV